MSVTYSLSPNPRAHDLADRMLSQRNVLREVLWETIQSGKRGVMKESGRTFCPRSRDLIRGPLGRFPRSVALDECPVGVSSGVVHAHVTRDELRQPHHSLPDMANLVFEGIDASVIVGTQNSDVMVTAKSAEAMQYRFRNALGLEVNSTRDVVNALVSGKINDAPALRQRVRSRLTPLFRRVSIHFPNLDDHVDDVAIADNMQAPKGTMSGCLSQTPMQADKRTEQINADMERGKEALLNAYQNTTSGVNLREIVIGSLLGSAVTAGAQSTIRWVRRRS